MVNVTAVIKCISCNKKQPNYNYLTEAKALYCNDCKKEGMINIKSQKCIICNNKQRHFNYSTESKALYCSDCKKEGMIDIKNRKCITCKNKIPTFNYPEEERAEYCGDCKEDDMVDVKTTKCAECNKKVPSYNYPGESIALYCVKCKDTDMIDVKSPKCRGQGGLCQTQVGKKYRGYCVFCFAHMFPEDPLTLQIRCKTKEIAVRDFINSNYEGFVHDKQLETAHCDCSIRRRIDHRKLINNTLLVIETDENQHKSYDEMDEEIRYNDLYMAFSGKWIYIRFNPDQYRSINGESKNTDMEIRLKKLGMEINKQIKRINLGENIELLEKIYLYYDGYD